MKTAIIGDGGWGTALALTLVRNGHHPVVWGPDAAYIETLRDTRRNPRYLPGIDLPEQISWTADPEETLSDAEAVVLVVPSKYMRSTLERFKPARRGREMLPVVSATKGFDEETQKRMTELIQDIWAVPTPAALSGPSIAPETAAGVPTAVTIASTDEDTARFFQNLFTGDTFRVYTTDDVSGVELGGALKNVIAIAAGVCDGLGFGQNAKAALITRGLAEMTRLGVSLGANPQTFYGLSGIGDLMVTCMSKQSRNRSIGERLGRGEKLADILSGMVQVVEGIDTCPNALALARNQDIPVPVMEQVSQILDGCRKPAEAVMELMHRNPKAERD